MWKVILCELLYVFTKNRKYLRAKRSYLISELNFVEKRLLDLRTSKF